MQGRMLKFPVYAPEGVLWALRGRRILATVWAEDYAVVQFKSEEEDQMKRWTLSMMCVVILFGIGLTASLAMADEDKRLSVTVAFGRGLNTAQPGNAVNHVVLPHKIKIKQGGVVHFLVAGFHQTMVYKPGTTPEDIQAFIRDTPVTGTFINDLDNLFYQGINPAGGPLNTEATPTLGPPRDDRSNAMNRVESVGFPASEGVGTNGVASLKAEPGVYLVICNIRGHFLDGMFAFVKVKAVKAEDEDGEDD